MLKALIVDDEENSREALEGKLKLFCPEITEIKNTGSVQGALDILGSFRPHVIFLDVKLSGESGFDLLEALQKEGAPAFEGEIIFTTAHDEFALRAIKFSALDYLLKPIDAEDLVLAIRKLEEMKSDGNNYKVLMEHVKGSNTEKKIVLPSSEGMYILKLSEIIRCESSSNYTQFFLTDNRRLMASKTLKEFDNLLCDYNFERVHKSHLINMDYVKRYIASDGGYLILEDGSRIPVANRKKEMLMNFLKSL